MLDILNYESRARNITLEKCKVYLSDSNDFNFLTIEHHNQNDLDILAFEDKLIIKRNKFTKPTTPVLFIHLSTLIGRNINLIGCDVTASLNLYELKLNLQSSQIKLFGKSDFLTIEDSGDSCINAKNFNCSNIQAKSKSSTKLLINTQSEIFTIEKHKEKHQKLYQDFIHQYSICPFISLHDKKYYKKILSFF